jgi:hypothetical protein
MNIRIVKMHRLQWIVGLVVLVLLPTLAEAQTAEERIEAAMARAQAAGIPVSLLESKRAEGRAKGVPMDRIATAVETRLKHLETARQAMTRGANDVDAAQLSVGADAIGAGVSEAVLAEITTTAGRDRRSVAVAALTYLVSREGLASNVALERVKTAMAQGPQALANLAARAGAGRGRIPEGIPPTGTPGAAGRSGAGGPPSSVPAPGQANPPTPPSRGGTRGGPPSSTPGGPPAGSPRGQQ